MRITLRLCPGIWISLAAAAVPRDGTDRSAGIKGRTRCQTRTRKCSFQVALEGSAPFAIQIAKWLGAHVTTTASKRGEALVRSLGCDEVIDYTAQDISEAGAGKFVAGFDLVGGKTLEQMFEIMRPGTKIVSIAAVPEPQTAIKDLGRPPSSSALFWIISYGIRSRARRAGIGYRYLFMHPSGSDLVQLAELIEQGTLKVVVDKTYPFAEISDALAYVERGRAKGKVVVTMS